MKATFALFIALACCSPLKAETVPAKVLSLPQILRISREKNPEILAARKSWEMISNRVQSMKSLPDPEVSFEFMGFDRSSFNPSGAEEKWYSIGQTFPFPGKLRLRGQAAEHGARREEDAYRGTIREVLSKVKVAYYNLLYAERSIQILQESVQVMRRFARIAEAKYGTGKTSQADVLRAQTELSKMLNMLETGEQERQTAQANLNALLDRHPEEPLSAREEPSLAPFNFTFDQLEAVALKYRPEIHGAMHHVSHMTAELRAAKADYLPDTMLQYTWRTREGMEADSAAMIKFNLPFIWFRRQNSIIQSVTSEREHAEAMLRSVTATARAEVKEYLVHVQTSRRLAELYKTTVLPQAEQSLKVTESAYQAGRTGFLDLLDSERALLGFQLEYYKYLSDYGANQAHLERAIGKDLNDLEAVK